MIRRPPRSTLFPTRRSSDLKIAGAAQARRRGAVLHHTTMAYAIDPAIVPRLIRIGRPTLEARDPDQPGRSEEHTSELQSLAYLVCRLLLEKKKKTPQHVHTT